MSILKLPQTITTATTTVTSTDKNQVNEHEKDEAEDNDDESLFVGDKALFSQDHIIKSDFSGTHSITEFNTPAEVSLIQK